MNFTFSKGLLGFSVMVFSVSVIWAVVQRPTEVRENRIFAERTANSELFAIETLLKNGRSHREVSWNAPKAQSEDGLWLYDVFTPPRIYINPTTGEFEPTPYQYGPQTEFPDLQLRNVRQSMFPYQLTGFIEHTEGEKEEVILLIEGLPEKSVQRMRISDKRILGNIWKMKGFSIERELTQQGAIQRYGVLRLCSTRDPDVEVILRSNSPTYMDGRIIDLTFKNTTFELNEDNTDFSVGDFVISWVVGQSDAVSLAFDIIHFPSSETKTVRLQISPSP
ncbi:MAG: hypothetical protein MI748_03800 [Opitutales bacterium]|nr:hypothetical protein [Opitutales bacterium]